MYTIYGKPDCYGCVASKELLDKACIPYSYIDVSRDVEARNKLMGLGFRAVPVIFKDGELLGGLTNLRNDLGEGA